MMDEMIDEILETGYYTYLEYGGTGRFDLGDIKKKYNVNIEDIGKYLVSRGLVKLPQFSTGNPDEFTATISMYGISFVHPEYIDNNRNQIISILGTATGEMSIMELLGLDPKDFQIGFDLAKEFESEELLVARYLADDVFITLSEEGVQYYEDNKPFFF